MSNENEAKLTEVSLEEQFDDEMFDKYADINDIDQEFFTPKEFSSMTLSAAIEIIKIGKSQSEITINDMRKAAELAAYLISMIVDDKSLERIFEKATQIVGTKENAVTAARRRLRMIMRGDAAHQ